MEKRTIDTLKFGTIEIVARNSIEGMLDINVTIEDCEGQPYEVFECLNGEYVAVAQYRLGDGAFVHEHGPGWLGIAFVSSSIAKTVFVRPDTDHGVLDCERMMERIMQMSDSEKEALINR